MNCEQCQELLSDYIDGLATGEQRAIVQSHIAECLPCFEVHNELLSIISRIQKLRPIYESPDYSTASEAKNEIISASEEMWADLISYFSRNPEQLYSLPPRKFEELVAELLTREGMQVELTPPTKDGGRDILAFNKTQAGQHLILVECKRYSKENPVDVSIIRALYGVVEAERATAGLLATTSFFTKGAKSFCDTVKYRLWLKDYNGIVEWLKQRH